MKRLISGLKDGEMDYMRKIKGLEEKLEGKNEDIEAMRR